MEQAIKRAIKGGWHRGELHLQYMPSMREDFPTVYFMHGNTQMSERLEKILIDKDFWKAIGEFEGWSNFCKSCGNHKDEHSKRHPFREGSDYWLYRWHDFIDHIAKDGDIDVFFNELLN